MAGWATPWFNRQGQAQIVSIAIRSPRSYSGKLEATPLFRTWFSIDAQPPSSSPTVNISIVFISALLDCGRIIHHPAIKNELRLPNNVHPEHVHAPSRYERAAILARSCEATADRMAAHRKSINAAFVFTWADFVNVHLGDE